MMADMVLELWPSDFLLPSVDCKSLQFLACSRICAAPFKIDRDFKPWRSPTGHAPVFRHGSNIVYTEFSQFANHLRKQLPELTLDGQLSHSQYAEAQSFHALLLEKLYPAYIYSLWLDEPNYNTVTCKWYTSHLPVFYGIYFVGKMRKWADNYLRQIYPGPLVTKEDIEYAVTKQAVSCINMISTKLGDKKFFFGDRPSSLDAVAFGYLAPLLKLPLPCDKFGEAIKSCQNLVRLVESMISIYMPLSDEEITAQRDSAAEWDERKLKAQAEMRAKLHGKSSATDKSEEDEYPMRDKLFFGVGAAVVMILFAVHFGFVQFNVEEVYEDNTSKNGNAAPIMQSPLMFDED